MATMGRVARNIIPTRRSLHVLVRLVNGGAPNEGRVEVNYECHWGTVCSQDWTIRDAHVVCRQLGYPSASQAWRSAHFGGGSGSILLNNVACRGNESSIDECHHSGWYVTSGCGHYSDAGVTCDLASPPPVSVRLINGNAPNEGGVEVYYKGQWGSVCGYEWRIEEARVVCRQLGYPSASQAWRFSNFGRSSGPVLLKDVACDGHESRIDQCDHSGWFNVDYCNHYYDVGVTCDVTTPSSVLVRLADGNTPYEGRVELYYQCYWGTVSDYGEWTIEDANVVCRQLGYPSASQAYGNAHFGRGSGLILLDNVECDGHESSIVKCDHSGWYTHNAGHGGDVGVACNVTHPKPVAVRLVNGSNPYEGRVEVYYQDQWGTVCDDDWSIDDAKVICRQLGLPPATVAWRGAHFGQGSGPILLNNVACTGNESSIDQCEHSEWFSHGCNHTDDVGVTCGETLNLKATSPVSVRLVGGSTPYEGRVEVYVQCQWGGIKSSQWSIKEANVICRELGHPSATQAWMVPEYFGASGPILLTNVACSGDESSIGQCDYDSYVHSDGYGDLLFYGYVAVTCNASIPPSVAVRLVDGSTTHEGRVEVYYRCQWGTICDYGWNIEDANVICRQLGYPSARQAWQSAHFGRGSGPILLANVHCDGHETTIDQCDHSGWFSHSCTRHSYDVGVTCNVAASSSAIHVVRLVNGSNPYEGRVEVYYQDQWGTICDDGWSIEDANVICRQLGYPPASQALQGGQFGQGSGPIVLSIVACNGNESNIDQCNHSGWLPNGCSHAEDAAVTCGDNHVNSTSEPIVSVRLVNGIVPNEGRVEVYYKCFWGTICHNGWTIREANVICRQLGYPSASQAWLYAHFGQGSGPILLDNVVCEGTEESIEQCEHSGWFKTSFGHYYDVGVTCNTDIDATVFPPEPWSSATINTTPPGPAPSTTNRSPSASESAKLSTESTSESTTLMETTIPVQKNLATVTTQSTTTIAGTTDSKTVLIPVVTVVIIIIVIVLAVVLFLCFRRHLKGRRQPAKTQPAGGQELTTYENHISPEENHISPEEIPVYEDVDGDCLSSHEVVAVNMSSPTCEDEGLPPWAQSWNIPYKSMMIGVKVLGKGHFGEVRDGAVMVGGEISKAAIKTLKANASDNDRQNFMEEFRTLTEIGQHPNVVSILGACHNDDILYVALEFMPNGDLRTYLRNARSQEDDEQSTLSSEKLIQFALDVAKGVQHLATIGVIHRDLAARNILLDNRLVAKVSDFGLSRGEDIYVQSSQTRVPTRWLSLESLTSKTYTSKSDVWSFGILLWEIATLGATPYQNIKTKNLLSRLENGYRMPKPSNCDDDIYNLMLMCWQEDPDNRPDFKNLVTRLTSMADNPIEHTYMGLLPKAEQYMNLTIRPELDDN